LQTGQKYMRVLGCQFKTVLVRDRDRTRTD